MSSRRPSREPSRADRTMRVGVVGLGYVGLPLAAEPPGATLRSVDLEDALEAADVAVIVTARPSIDHDTIAHGVPVVDSRGGTRRTARPRTLLTRDPVIEAA